MKIHYEEPNSNKLFERIFGKGRRLTKKEKIELNAKIIWNELEGKMSYYDFRELIFKLFK